MSTYSLAWNLIHTNWNRLFTKKNLEREILDNRKLTILGNRHPPPGQRIQIEHKEVVAQCCSLKKLVLEISQKFTGKHMPQPATLLKKRLWHRCFPVNFAKFLRPTFLTEHLRWLLLNITERNLRPESRRVDWSKQLIRINNRSMVRHSFEKWNG